MNAIRRSLGAAVLLALLGAVPGALGARSDVPTLNVEYVPDIGYAPYFVAKYEGLFKKYGVNVNLVNTPIGVTNTEIVGGQLDLATIGPAQPLAVADQGMPVSIVYSLVQNPGYALISNPQIPTIAALRAIGGCRVATSTPGGLGYGWWLEYRAKLGLSNCSPTSITSLPAVIAAVGAGSVDAAVVAMGTAVIADAPPPNGAGTNLLVDPTSAGWKQTYAGVQPYPVPIPVATVWGLKSDLAAKRGAIVSLIAALDEAMRLITPANYTKVATWVKLGDPADFGTQPISQIVQELQGEGPWMGVNSVILPHVKAGQRQPDPNTLVGYVSPFTWSATLAALKGAGLPNFDPSASVNAYSSIVDMSFWRQAYRQYLRKTS